MEWANQIDEVIVSVTNRCTILCRYCSELHNPLNRNKADLSTEDFRVILSHILAATEKAKITVVFFGGEPTLRGTGWLSEQIEWLGSEAGLRGRAIRPRMSSNGELINDSWCDFFKRYHFIPGISYDGPEEISAPARPAAQGAERAIRLLTARGMRPGIMVVATKKNMQNFNILCESLEDLDIRFFHILYQSSFDDRGRYDEPDAADLLEAARYFLHRMIIERQYPVETRLRTYVDRFVSEAVLNRGMGCLSLYCPAGTWTAYVHPSGRVYPCSSFARPGEELAHVEAGRIVPDRHDRVRACGYLRGTSCLSCPAARICFFGCGAQRGPTQAECTVTQGIFDYLQGLTRQLGERAIADGLEWAHQATADSAGT